jgi:hypothetical protein
MATGFGVASPFPLSENQATSVYVGPFGRRFQDPATGKEYLLCDAQEAFDAGEWALINASGQAIQLTSTSKGRVGIVVAAAATSDLAVWVQVVGEYAGGYCSSDVTSAGRLIAPATTDVGIVTIMTSTDANIIYGAAPTTAAVSTVSPTTFGTATATFYLNNPWVDGVAHSFAS